MLEALFNKNKISLGISKIGGIGDTFHLLFLTHAIKRKYPNSMITLYIRDQNDWWKRDPAVDQVVFTGACDWDKWVKTEAKKYDIFFDDRYIVGIWKKGNLINLSEMGKQIYWDFFDYLFTFKGNLLEKAAHYAEVKLIDKDINLDFLVTRDKFRRLIDYKYILVCPQFEYLRQTKAYPLDNWNILTGLIKKRYPELRIIQMGLKGTNAMIKNTIYLNGQTSFDDVCELMKGAEAVVCSEGMYAHLARGLKTKAIVLFGATKAENFGYKDNINIEGDMKCHCWYESNDWYSYCMRYKRPYCLKLAQISPFKILDSLMKILEK